MKKFDETKFNSDIKTANINIDNIKGSITDILTHIKSVNSGLKQELILQITNYVTNTAQRNSQNDPTKNIEFKNLFSHLYEEWKYAKYEAQSLSDCKVLGEDLS